MLYEHFTEKLLGLQGLKVTNIENEEKTVTIYAKMERKAHNRYSTRLPNTKSGSLKTTSPTTKRKSCNLAEQ